MIKGKRFPIYTGHNGVMLIHIFEHDLNLEDLGWLVEGYEHEEGSKKWRENSKQFIEQLEENWCPAFLMALRDEITDTLKEHDEKYGTKFANQLNQT